MKSKRIAVAVTQRDIDSPVIYSPREDCPVAKAINRAFNKKRGFAKVGRISITLGMGVEYLQMGTPRPVFDFIEKFDEKEEVEPFTFTLKY